jgi:hypothetical protein
MESGKASWRGLSYTALESLIIGLHSAQPQAVRARFRKLRLRPFPDDIRSGQGNRVDYDLSRTLAIIAVFEVNALHVPQGQAAAIVEATWPEWCRASIAAACGLGLITSPQDMPAWSAATVTMLPDAFMDAPTAVAAHASRSDVRLSEGGAPAIAVEVTRLVSALHSAVPEGDADALTCAFEDLERSHGWTRKTFPSRSELAQVARGRGFLEKGPYEDRARALLDATLDGGGHVLLQHRGRLQAIADYLDEPAPVDAWKSVVGTDGGSARLGHLLQAWAVQIGLKPRKQFPEAVLATAGDEPDVRARTLLDAIGRTPTA